MSAPFSPQLQRIFDEAAALAKVHKRSCGSDHLLMALVSETNVAGRVLMDKGVDWKEASDPLKALDDESPGFVGRLRARARQIAGSCGSSTVDSLHLLAAICRSKESNAHRLLLQQGVSPSELITTVISYITSGKVPRRFRVEDEGRGGVAGLDLARSTSRAVRGSGRRDGRSPLAQKPAGSGASTVARKTPLQEDLSEERRSTVTEEPIAVAEALPPSKGISELLPVEEGLEAPARPSEWTPDQEPVRADSPPDLSELALDPERFPLLVALGRNLTLEAARGDIDPLVAREEELHQVVDILNKRRANNPCLVGPPGVGKTAIVEGLARAIACRPGGLPGLANKVVVAIDAGTLMAGTSLRGSLSERIRDLREEVIASDGRVVVFFDELHAVVGPSGDSGSDAGGDLKAALARGEFPCIGATTEEEYRKGVEGDPALARRFVEVFVAEPSPEQAREILDGLRERYEGHHGLRFTDDALDAAVQMSHRYLSGRFLPDKAIHLLDLAGARCRRHDRSEVDRAAIAEVAADELRVPVERLLMSDAERLLQMEAELARRVIGHEYVLERLAHVVRRNHAGFAGHRPIGSFLFLGPTGVGKTETAKVLADFLFASRDAMLSVDMSEYMERHSVARLIGAPPGYVGHEDGGQLTEAVRRRPYQVVLLDEIEKAHGDVLKILLQVLDEGRLTDGRGRVVDFSNTVMIMTSNLGSRRWAEGRRAVGFGVGSRDEPGHEQLAEGVLADAREHFAPELWNRIEERLVFSPLTMDQVAAVAGLLMQSSSERLRRDRKISYRADPTVIQYLIEHGGWSPELGARPMLQTIQRLIEGPLAEVILRGEALEGDTVCVSQNEQGSGLLFSVQSEELH